MKPVRKIFDLLENFYDGKNLNIYMKKILIRFILEIEIGQSIELDSITTEDVEKVLSTTKPSAHVFKDKYTQWQKEFESV